MAKKVCILQLINIKQDNKSNKNFCINFYFVAFIFSLVNETLKQINTFELTTLKMLCNGNQHIRSIEQYLKDLFVRFEIIKSSFSSNVRHLWHHRFSHLADECQRRNISQEIVSFALKLADHAYKLPERMEL